jgi:hypothetical protein
MNQKLFPKNHLNKIFKMMNEIKINKRNKNH